MILFDTFEWNQIDEDGNQCDSGNRGDDMFKINPYRPGAGLMPTYLAGRCVESVWQKILSSDSKAIRCD